MPYRVAEAYGLPIGWSCRSQLSLRRNGFILARLERRLNLSKQGVAAAALAEITQDSHLSRLSRPQQRQSRGRTRSAQGCFCGATQFGKSTLDLVAALEAPLSLPSRLQDV